jgi:hypothetical protein
MVGRNNGGYAERVLHPLAAELGLADVTYIPHVDVTELREILADSDVAILASRFDNSPLTIFEALSSGVPVITSDRVGTASWIEPENGLLTLPVDDPDRFARDAVDALTDPVWMATGPSAAARMREKFAPEHVTERLLQCYGRLMAERGRAPHQIATPGSVVVAAVAETNTLTSADELARNAQALTELIATAPAARLDGARAHAVLAFAEELVSDPSLLAAWSAAFTGGDDVSLVIYAPGWTAREAESRLAPAVQTANLDGEDGADLLAIATTATPTFEAQLVAGCSAVLTHRLVRTPFEALRTLPADAVAGLQVPSTAA